MRTDAAQQADIARAMLQDACARNLSGEIHYENVNRRGSARMRFLAVEENRIYTDRPQSIGMPVAFRPRQCVTVHFLTDGTRYAFQTRVVAPLTLVRLNDEQQVVGMSFGLPSEVRKQQRRSTYRVAVISQAIRVDLHPVSREDLTCCLLDADRLSGWLANVSAGGLTLFLEMTQPARFQLGDAFCVQFALPDVPEPMVLPAEVRHVSRIHDGQAVRVGLCFLPCDLYDTRSQVVRISRFVAAEQRRRLRRRR